MNKDGREKLWSIIGELASYGKFTETGGHRLTLVYELAKSVAPLLHYCDELEEAIKVAYQHLEKRDIDDAQDALLEAAPKEVADDGL